MCQISNHLSGHHVPRSLWRIEIVTKFGGHIAHVSIGRTAMHVNEHGLCMLTTTLDFNLEKIERTAQKKIKRTFLVERSMSTQRDTHRNEFIR